MAAQQPKPLPFMATFTAGAIAGVTETLIFYPLDVVKTRIQLETGKTKHGTFGTFTSIIREEGLGRMYRGLLAPLLLEAPKRAVTFAANDFWGRVFLRLSGENEMTQTLAFLTGCSSGATETFVVTPFELVKIKLQDKTSTFTGPSDVVKRIVRKEGLLGLYGGMEATFWRQLSWNGMYFGCIHSVRRLMPEAETARGQLINNFVSGTVGGFLGTCVNIPFDVVKSRVQKVNYVPGVIPKYNWTFPALLMIFREEGLRALYKGFVPKVLRYAPGGGVLLIVVDFTLGVFRNTLGPPYV